MQSLPTEISQQIYALACTDNGKTGRSLSLVSRRIHHASKPFKLRSISISGAEQAVAFAGVLQNIPSHLLNVVYLDISNKDRFGRWQESDKSSNLPLFRRISRAVSHFIFGAKRYGTRLKIDHYRRDLDSLQRQERTLFDTTFKILSIIASTIRHVDIYYRSRSPILPFRPDAVIPALPVLTSLRLDCFSVFDVGTLPCFAAPFLSLKYLVVGNFEMYHGPIDPSFDLGAYIAKQTPSLAYLKLSVGSFEWALNLSQDGLGGKITNNLPFTLERVFIPVPAMPLWDDMRMVDSHMIALPWCKELARKDDRVIVLDGDNDGTDELYPLRYRY